MIVSYSKYPPVGTRGYGPMFAAHALPGVSGGAHYDNNANDGLQVIVQIESKQGVNNVKDIAAVEGVDILLIGMFLAISPAQSCIKNQDLSECYRTFRSCKTSWRRVGKC